MTNIEADLQKNPQFDWSASECELGIDRSGIINIGWLCSDRPCQMGKAAKTALLWEDHQGVEKVFTYNDIRILSNNIAAYLEGLGLKPGERICLFMDRVPELYIGFLGILKLGAVAQPLFSAFGEESLFTRLDNAQTSAIITQRKHALKVRKIRDQLPNLRYIIIVDAGEGALKEREIAMDMEKLPKADDYKVYPTKAETSSVLHYTSGTTGQPKGAQHVHYSIVSQYITAKWVLDLKDDDIYWCNADPGWVTGTSYGIIGPWVNGVTQAVLDSGFNAERWYKFIEKYKITVWYSAPTAIRLLMREGKETVQKFNLSSLRHLCSVGEPLNAEAVHWSKETFGRPFHDTFWQTETGCIVITNHPALPVKPGSMGKPFPGIEAAVLNPQTFEPVNQTGIAGLIALKPGWPSMVRSYWNNPTGYQNKFKNGWYLCGDRASIDIDGYYWFMGRDDDVINTGGHLVGPFEIESALLEHPAVAESAAVAKPDPINMEVVKAFVVLKPGYAPSDDMELDIMNLIRKRLSPLAMPQEIEFIDALPKTRSGKIVRRILRAKEFNEPLGDMSTVMND
ncbi:MAG: acetate--CoA ligase [Calditrichaeota bacterium]|nr:acetate--CoA ligase [Calditrichota bacterium]